MLKKSTCILIFLAVSLTAVAAQGVPIYGNGDFEDDAALVPNPRDTVAAIPTGWQYDDYWSGYGVQPVLMNVSHIGDRSGGNVGVMFPNWNDEGGWYSAITRFEQPVMPGSYTYTVTVTGQGLRGPRNWMYADVSWISDPADPWSQGDWDYLTNEVWVQLSASDNGVWQTIAVDFDVMPGDPSVGKYLAPYVAATNYNGNIIIGEATLVHHQAPEPATLLLLSTGLVGLVGFRKKFKK